MPGGAPLDPPHDQTHGQLRQRADEEQHGQGQQTDDRLVADPEGAEQGQQQAQPAQHRDVVDGRNITDSNFSVSVRCSLRSIGHQ